MSEYIKRDDAVEEVAFELMYEAAIAMNLSYKELVELEASKQERIKMYVRKWLEQVPTADVVEVRHSVWRVASADPDKEYECMRCKKAVGWKYLYCPNCGARMDREEQENERSD